MLKYLNHNVTIIIISTFSLNLFLLAMKGNSFRNRSKISGAHYLEQINKEDIELLDNLAA